jgi:hypothetical protein
MRSLPCQGALKPHLSRIRTSLDTWWNEFRPITAEPEEVRMSFFSKILEKLGFKTAKAEPAPAPKAPPPSVAPAPSAPPPPPPPKPIEVVDVVAQLEKLAAANPQKLNWKVSIVDLLKLLDIDSSFAARKELATELGCPAELMGDSAKMNMWLHKTVLKKIADNGGNVPKELLD